MRAAAGAPGAASERIGATAERSEPGSSGLSVAGGAGGPDAASGCAAGRSSARRARPGRQRGSWPGTGHIARRAGPGYGLWR